MIRPRAGMEGFLVAFVAGGAACHAWWRYLLRTPRPTMRTRLLFGGVVAGAGVVGVILTEVSTAILAFPLLAMGVAIVVMKVRACPHCGKVVVPERSLLKPARHCRWCGGPIDPW